MINAADAPKIAKFVATNFTCTTFNEKTRPTAGLYRIENVPESIIMIVADDQYEAFGKLCARVSKWVDAARFGVKEEESLEKPDRDGNYYYRMSIRRGAARSWVDELASDIDTAVDSPLEMKRDSAVALEFFKRLIAEWDNLNV